MNIDLLKIAVGGVIGAHAIGHVLGWMPAWGLAKFEGMSSHSWLLNGLVGDGSARLIGGVLWFVPMVGFLAATGAFFLGHAWWRPLAVGSAMVSLGALVLFFDALPVSSRIGCVAVDLAVLYGLLVADWPSAAVGS